MSPSFKLFILLGWVRTTDDEGTWAVRRGENALKSQRDQRMTFHSLNDFSLLRLKWPAVNSSSQLYSMFKYSTAVFEAQQLNVFNAQHEQKSVQS